MTHIKGIGGVFIRCQDHEASTEWYKRVLGMEIGPWGLNLPATDLNDSDLQVFSLFKQETNYLAPSTLPIMINLLVKDLDALLLHLKSLEIPLIGEPLNESYGKFAWIMDPNGIKLELWEAIHS